MRYVPLLSETVVRVPWIVSPETVTVTPGITPALLSATVPTMLPVNSCATNSAAENQRSSPDRMNRHFGGACFIATPFWLALACSGVKIWNFAGATERADLLAATEAVLKPE